MVLPSHRRHGIAAQIMERCGRERSIRLLFLAARRRTRSTSKLGGICRFRLADFVAAFGLLGATVSYSA
jgi:GNAT superfamily N-acetyltransferase